MPLTQISPYVSQRFTLKDSRSPTRYQRNGLEGIILEAPEGDTRANYVFAYYQKIGAPYSYFLILPEKVRFVDPVKRVVDTEWVACGAGYTSGVIGFGKVIHDCLADARILFEAESYSLVL